MKGKSLQKALIGGGFTRARARVGAGVAELIDVVDRLCSRGVGVGVGVDLRMPK